MLHLVVTSGTGKAAQVGDEYIWGKTGTTENYGDAWFVGGNDDMTVAVWVGYADKIQPMEFEHAGGPVAGGTFPAEIFHDFMTSWLSLREARRAARGGDDETTTTPESGTTAPATPGRPERRARRRAAGRRDDPGRPGRRGRHRRQPAGGHAHARGARGRARARGAHAGRARPHTDAAAAPAAAAPAAA